MCSRAIARDENVYAEPDEFKPERFSGLHLGEDNLCDPRKYIFGHGRRYVAESH